MSNKKISDRALKTKIKDLYLNYEENESTAFSSPYVIYKYLKSRGFAVTLAKVKYALEHVETYQKHKDVRVKFTRRPILSKGIDYLHEADLIHLPKLTKHNDGKAYILNVIDVLSKRISLESIKTKSPKDVIPAFKRIYARRKRPQKLHTDRGTEFCSKQAMEYFESNNIIRYSNNSSFKAAIVERSNRTLLNIMFKYLSQNKTNRYVEFLPNLEKIINNSYHRSIDMKPSEVNKKNEKQIWKKLYSKYFKIKQRKDNYLPPGTVVRISKYQATFNKKYMPNFTNEKFIIHKVTTDDKSGLYLYSLRDLNNEDILGIFYKSDLSVVRE
jgi:hypothetical protein